MKFSFLTLFTDMFKALNSSVFSRGEKAEAFSVEVINIRDFSTNKHKKCDDTPFGGGAGMIMTAQPIFDAVSSVITEKSYVIYLSPQGKVLTQNKVIELSKKEHLIFLCGHYEGIDQRVIDMVVDEEISIGNYILTGGELPAMCLADSISRYIPGVLGNLDSVVDESFSTNLLEAPLYTKPATFKGLDVPAVLMSGNHEEIRKWRKLKAIEVTKKKRPDIL